MVVGQVAQTPVPLTPDLGPLMAPLPVPVIVGDQTSLTPPEGGPLLGDGTIQAMQGNFPKPDTTGLTTITTAVQEAPKDKPAETSKVQATPSEERLSAKSLADVNRGASSSGIERGPTYGNESVEMPGQVAGSGGSELVLHKSRPEEAISQLGQEQARQDVARSSASGQAARSQSLEDGLQIKQQALQDGRINHQRELGNDAAKLEGARGHTDLDKADLQHVADHEASLNGQIGEGEKSMEGLRLDEINKTSGGLAASQDTKQADAGRYRSKGGLIKGDDYHKVQQRERDFESGLRGTQDRRGRVAQDVVFLRQGRDQAGSRRTRAQQELTRNQDRLQADQASFQDRKLGDVNIVQRGASMGRQADNAGKARQANVVNQQAAQGNAVYVRQMSDSLARTDSKDSHEFKQRSLIRPHQGEPEAKAGARPATEDRGDILVVQLKPLNGGVGGVDSVGDVSSGGSRASRDGMPAIHGVPDVTRVSQSSGSVASSSTAPASSSEPGSTSTGVSAPVVARPAPPVPKAPKNDGVAVV